ncbi:hypothetical protein BJV78DRAFT_1211070 [Lactifluus subvellereus]|nr:hypothetical protein BJV78DRAFT_1211070 [Lactifluus subvellereus]
MESSATVSRRRPSSHMRENHSLENDFLFFLSKRNREGSREQAHALSDDDDIPTSRGEKHRRKKKHASSSLNTPSNPAPRPGPSIDTFVERSHRSSKQRHGVSSSLSDVPSNIARSIPRSKREVSREGKHSSAKASSVAAVSDDEAGPPSTYGGPIVAMEFNRMKRDLEALKKQAVIHTKIIQKQANTILTQKNELRSMHQSHEEQLSQIEVLETKIGQADELTSNIEGTLQCQICIDTLSKPFALSPCGHVLCQRCLQDWFRNAPVPQDEMNVDEPLPLILRKKTCPFCRAAIRSRPLPLFVLKNLLSVLAKGKPGGVIGSSRPSPLPDLVDPWAEIFPPLRSDSESDAEDDDPDYSAEDDYWGMYDDDDDVDEGLQDYDDTSNDEYEGEWVPPTWEPPNYRAATPLDPASGIDVLLRRGATYGMIETYHMEYGRREGITAYLDGMCLFLGWNIELADEDENGERFIAWCLDDLDVHPYRWMFEGHGRVHRLVRRDAVEEYSSTDSENWIGVEDEEDEEVGE